VAATPDSAKQLAESGFRVVVTGGAGLSAGFADADYEAAGAAIGEQADAWAADIVIKVRAPSAPEIALLHAGQTLISYLYPAQNADLLNALSGAGITAIGMDQVPRTTRAQKVDALSSMGNLSGYRGVVEAAHALQRPLGGQTTAAGRIPPCTVLVIGAGVAGLAAIGAARSLGAIVRAFDTRPAVREQIASMGAEFLEVSAEEDGTGRGGYAREMSPAFVAAERALFAAQAKDVDVIITTALIPGKRAPILITGDMVASMRRGSVVVDLAAEMGGNCEKTVPGEAVDVDGVTVIGYTDMPSRLARQASTLYATNVVNLLEEMGGAATFTVDEQNDIVGPMTVVKNGVVTWPPSTSQGPTLRPEAAASAGQGPSAPAAGASPPPAGRTAVQSALHKRHGPPVGAPSRKSWIALGVAGLALYGVGVSAPPSFLTHLTVFVLACFIGYQVIWNVTPALHTPLMSVTNAISGIIIVGGMLQIAGGTASAAELLGLAATFVAMINVSGGFLVTHRMLKMFRR
jgi:NAD(P) transhydrogenase subunit alpha